MFRFLFQFSLLSSPANCVNAVQSLQMGDGIDSGFDFDMDGMEDDEDDDDDDDDDEEEADRPRKKVKT